MIWVHVISGIGQLGTAIAPIGDFLFQDNVAFDYPNIIRTIR